MNNNEFSSVVEGLLYLVGDEGLTIEQIAFVLDVEIEYAREIILELKNKYELESRGLQIINTANSYKFATNSLYIDYYKKLLDDPKGKKLSNANMEVVAIIAYRQPITRAEIEDVRGVNCDNIIRKLLSFNLIKEVGRLETPGRPIVFGTTDEFLDYFGINSLNELPDIEDEVKVEEDNELFNQDGITFENNEENVEVETNE